MSRSPQESSKPGPPANGGLVAFVVLIALLLVSLVSTALHEAGVPAAGISSFPVAGSLLLIGVLCFQRLAPPPLGRSPMIRSIQFAGCILVLFGLVALVALFRNGGVGI
jgi:protein-S-isoprenylcysteine O-methyltransferase Ste14